MQSPSEYSWLLCRNWQWILKFIRYLLHGLKTANHLAKGQHWRIPTFLFQNLLQKNRNQDGMVSGLLWWLSDKESTCQCRRHALVPGLGRSHMPWAARPVHQDSWACALEPRSCSYWSPHTLEPVLHHKRSCCNEKPAHRRVAPTHRN